MRRHALQHHRRRRPPRRDRRALPPPRLHPGGRRVPRPRRARPPRHGLAVELGLQEHIPFRTASLAKVFAGRAGIVACDRRVVDWLPFHSLNAIYSSTLLPQDIAGLYAALHVIRTDDVRRKRLWSVTDRLHAALREVGCDTRPGESPILPLHAGPDDNLAEIQHHLDERGILGAAFLPPTTPPATGRSTGSRPTANSPTSRSTGWSGRVRASPT
ncbi:aminotransferase class I/II-fold pyridoxal phosphate-dependent enzyme [Streptomyces sp. NPDC088097]|uniref:aminotransferase class I/II-fold pyridoxal phosphate-dependent enzyme n=1 Tax=Streptomyces sp. NPDC088097 TaxID=3365823 RepID=UPI0037F3167A